MYLFSTAALTEILACKYDAKLLFCLSAAEESSSGHDGARQIRRKQHQRSPPPLPGIPPVCGAHYYTITPFSDAVSSAHML